MPRLPPLQAHASAGHVIYTAIYITLTKFVLFIARGWAYAVSDDRVRRCPSGCFANVICHQF
jgi:hypothetical protein